MIVRYHKGAESPDIALTWRDSSGAVIDYSGSYTFELKIGSPGATALLTKTTNITGAQTSPNVTMSFLPDELDTIPDALWVAQLRARNTPTSKDRFMRFWFQILPSIT